MRQKQNRSESLGKDEESVERRPLTKVEAKEAMARFELLTKGLLRVSHEQLKREEERYQVARKAAQTKRND
jgi:hypothetical protein